MIGYHRETPDKVQISLKIPAVFAAVGFDRETCDLSVEKGFEFVVIACFLKIA